MDDVTWAWIGAIGAIGGSLAGIAGGAFGTYCSIANARGPRERAFIIRVAVVTWIAVCGFLAAMFLLPSPERYLLWIPYPFALGAGIAYANRTQGRLRAEEGCTATPGS